MRPCSLQRATSWRIARTIVNVVWLLDITKEQDRTRLVVILGWLAEDEYRCLSYPVLQNELHKALAENLRSKRNPPVYLTCMLALCPQVTVDLINTICDGDSENVADLVITLESSHGILEVVEEFQKQQSLWGGREGYSPKNVKGGEENTGERGDEERERLAAKEDIEEKGNEKSVCGAGTYEGGRIAAAPLCTKTLVLEAVYFQDPDTLPRLVEKMPSLQHISLQYNITASVVRTLSQHCRDLESLCFLEQFEEASILDEDILSLLYGIPAQHITGDLLERFHKEGEEFRHNFVPQFPNLRVLDIEELFLHSDIMHTVYILALLLQPKLECLGKLLFLSLKDLLMTFWRIWGAMHGPSSVPAVLPLTYAKFNEELFLIIKESELQRVMRLLSNLTCMELVMCTDDHNEMMGNIVRMFSSSHVKAMSLSNLPLSNMSSLKYLQHLRLTLGYHYPFDTVHLILDGCPNLSTLSVHPKIFYPPDYPNHGQGDPPRPMLDDDRRSLEDLLLADALRDLADQLGVLDAGGENRHCEGVRRPAYLPAQFSSPHLHKKTYAPHTKLTTLRIASICKARRQPTEAFLYSLLTRLPYLRRLCLGPWMGCPSIWRPAVTCTATALVSTLTQASLDSTRLLTQLEQLCCLPSSQDGEETCQSLLALAETLPALRCIALPTLDPPLLAPTFRHFRHAHIELRNKCDTDRVFSSWDPEH